MNNSLTPSNIKLIRQLKDRDSRYSLKLFWAEGERAVSSLLEYGTELKFAVVSDDNYNFTKKFPEKSHIYICKQKDINKIKSTKSFSGVGAVFKMPEFKELTQNTIIACNGINDPGNLGTIFRTALWFNHFDLIIDDKSTDQYHEKTIRASMGTVSKINCKRTDDLKSLLLQYQKNGFSLLASDLKGENFSNARIPEKKIMIFGNEANGISDDILAICDHKLKIPKYGIGESLNVSVAFGIFLSKINDL